VRVSVGVGVGVGVGVAGERARGVAVLAVVAGARFGPLAGRGVGQAFNGDPSFRWARKGTRARTKQDAPIVLLFFA
jgi:hypothetical protein